jgi:agmatinase
MRHHAPPQSPGSPRFRGIGTYSRLPQLAADERADFGIIGVPFDLGASFRNGQRFGPAAVREASRLVRLAHPYHWIDVYEFLSGGDYGDAPVYPADLAQSIAAIEEYVRPIVAGGTVPIAIGGDHTVSLPLLRAVAAAHDELALVHFDAHTDTDDELFGSKVCHGTPFRRALEEGLIDPKHSIQVGIRGSTVTAGEIDDSRALGFEVIEAPEMFALGAAGVAERILARVGSRKAYLTFDVDFLDPAYAPGTGTPEVGGPASHEALAMLRGLGAIPFVGFDVVEVLPAADHGQITALLAANVIFEFIALLAVRRRAAGRTT